MLSWQLARIVQILERLTGQQYTGFSATSLLHEHRAFYIGAGTVEEGRIPIGELGRTGVQSEDTHCW